MEKLAAILMFAVLISTISGMTLSAEALIPTMGFQFDYDPANWTFNANTGDGFVDESNTPDKIMLTGNDDGQSNITTEYETTIGCDGTVSFDWLFDGEPTPGAQGPDFDPSGYFIDGTQTQLTDDNGPEVQSGSASTPVVAGEVFGFYIHSLDGIVGPGIFVMIDNFKGPTCKEVGGELLPLDTTALLLAGVQSVSMWMIPVVVSGAGIGVFVIMRNRK